MTDSELPLVIGLDLGTGGARAVVVTADGQVVGSGRAALEGARSRGADGRHHEQRPETWWTAAAAALDAALAQHAAGPAARAPVVALCVDGTSGTIVGVDARGAPTTTGILYDDGRAVAEARELDALARTEADSLVPTIGATFGLAKMRWVERQLPDAFARTRWFLHQADIVAAGFTGRWGVSDASNALKSGFDLAHGAWARWLDQLPDLRARLPDVVTPGDRLGELSHASARRFGLAPGLPVIAGATDGTAAFLASGAHTPGDDNTTLGTTLVFKRVAERPVRDPAGLLYCHGLPGGRWLPGAASNVGAGWMADALDGRDPHQLDRDAAAWLPSEHLALPLVGVGERFPFQAPEARSFCEPQAHGPALDAAHLQGTACIERLAYEVLDRTLGQPPSGERPVYATGGGAASDLWTQLRADVTGRTYHRPAIPESAFGSAILAAGATLHADVWQAARAMVSIQRSFNPDPSRRECFDEYHQRFCQQLVQRGYLPDPVS